MRPLIFTLATLTVFMTTSCGDDFRPETIIGLERAALDRWNNGDVRGYEELFAPEITYFDPMTEKRIDSAEAMNRYLAPIAGKIHTAGYDMLDPKVQRYGEVAILTFNLLVYGKEADGSKKVIAKWNSTEVYRQTGAQWKIVHNHWSFIQPELKNPPAGPQ